MTTALRRLPLVLSLVAGAFAGGCGDRAPRWPPGPTTQVPDDLALLLPEEASILVYAPSVESLARKASVLARAIDPEKGGDLGLDASLRELLGPAHAQLDRQRPIAVAVGLRVTEKGPTFLPVVVLPVIDPSEAVKPFQAVREDPRALVRGRYLAVSVGEGRVRSLTRPSPLVEDLPVGDLVVRMELGGVVAGYRPLIDTVLGWLARRPPDRASPRMGDLDLGGLIAGAGEAARKMVESAERLDLALTAEGTRLDIDARFTALEGSALDGAEPPSIDMASLAAALPSDWPIQLLVSADLVDISSALARIAESIRTALPPERADSFSGQIELLQDLHALLRGGFAVAVRFGEEGYQGVGAAGVVDPQAYLARIDRALADLPLNAVPGVTMYAVPRASLEGAEARGWRVALDLRALLGEGGQGEAVPPEVRGSRPGTLALLFEGEGLECRVAVVGDRVVTTIGGGEALLARAVQAMRAGAAPAAPLAEAIRKAGGNPSLLVRLDLRALVVQFQRLMWLANGKDGAEPSPPPPEGPSIPLLIHGSGRGREYRGGISLDIGEIARVIGGAGVRRR